MVHVRLASRNERPVGPSYAGGETEMRILGICIFLVVPATIAAALTLILSGTLAIGPVWARAIPSGADIAAGYASIENMSSKPDRLVGAEFGAAREVRLHQTDSNGPGASMRAVPFVLIPARETVVLKPGGYHVMAAGLGRALVAGEEVEGALIFETAGRAPVLFRVEPTGTTEPPPE